MHVTISPLERGTAFASQARTIAQWATEHPTKVSYGAFANGAVIATRAADLLGDAAQPAAAAHAREGAALLREAARLWGSTTARDTTSAVQDLAERAAARLTLALALDA